LVIQAIDALESNFLLLSRDKIKCGIGEVDGAVGTKDDVIRAVQFLAFETVSEDLVFSVGSDLNDGAKDAGAVNEAMIAVVGVAVGIAERNDFLLLAVERNVENFVGNFIADVKEPRFVIYRAFGKPKPPATSSSFELWSNRSQNFGERASSPKGRAGAVWAASEAEKTKRVSRRNRFLQRVSREFLLSLSQSSLSGFLGAGRFREMLSR